MHSNSEMIRKLQIALNSKGKRILCNRSQFYSEQQKRPVTMYKISQSRIINDKTRHIALFESASEIQIVLFLRNLWYAVQGKEIPPTNKMKGAEIFERKWNEFANTELESFLEMSNNKNICDNDDLDSESDYE